MTGYQGMDDGQRSKIHRQRSTYAGYRSWADEQCAKIRKQRSTYYAIAAWFVGLAALVWFAVTI